MRRDRGLPFDEFVAAHAALLEQLDRRKHYTSICNAGPSELLATMALQYGEQIRARNRAIIAPNLPVFEAFFASHADRLEWEAPQGGCVSYPRYRGAEGVEAFCRSLVEQAGVLLLPASVYKSELGAVPVDRLRIGVGRRDPEPALAAFDSFLTSQ